MDYQILAQELVSDMLTCQALLPPADNPIDDSSRIINSDTKIWRLTGEPTLKFDKKNLWNWFYSSYAESDVDVCYYYHIVFQLPNAAVCCITRLSLKRVQKLRHIIYSGWHRSIAKNNCELLRSCRDFLMQQDMDIRHIEKVIDFITSRKCNATLFQLFMQSLRMVMSQLIQSGNAELVDVVFRIIINKE